MGIDNFTKLVKRYAPEAIESHEYSEFAGETWDIDASIFFYRFSHDPQSKKTNPHIDGFYQLIYRLLKNGIYPIFVTDGKTPKQKLHTLKKRSEQTQKNIKKVEDLQEDLITMLGGSLMPDDQVDNSSISQTQTVTLQQLVDLYKGHPLENELKDKLAEINKASKNIIQFKPNVYQDIYKLCGLFSVPIYRANWEADSLCTKFYARGLVKAIMSEDSDILLYNGGRLIRKFNWSNTVEVINIDKLLEKLKINYDQFVDLCILCGTDYTVETISGLGAIRAYELISQGLTIENIIDNIKKSKMSSDKTLKAYRKYDLPEDMSDFDYQSVRDLIKQAHSLEEDINFPSFDVNNIKFDELSQFMTEKCNYKSQTIKGHFQQLRDADTKLKASKDKIKIPLKIKLKTQGASANKIKITLK